eukprot:CAMPEP_0177668864 /NCGR_PEP_ID=MMETSP0447-20121125/23053_1 /TAXON_ID=0 /ORGANISM="Stygamoeba regulata, Strain BSH-02190019" /LENGTH=110 /DNA_ID=CAMNT_0019175529 /DNA_START=69 /DNA_END=398 /DNA_ORIENTATION=-
MASAPPLFSASPSPPLSTMPSPSPSPSLSPVPVNPSEQPAVVSAPSGLSATMPTALQVLNRASSPASSPANVAIEKAPMTSGTSGTSGTSTSTSGTSTSTSGTSTSTSGT